MLAEARFWAKPWFDPLPCPSYRWVGVSLSSSEPHATGRGINRWESGARFPEWADLKPSEPIRQGDVLASIAPSSDPWRQLVFVLTADCDLARSKHGGALSCIPILSCSDYLIRFRFERIREAYSRRLVERLLKASVMNSVLPGNGPRISSARMRDWAIEADAGTIAAALGLNGSTGENFTALAQALRELAMVEPESLEEAIGSLSRTKVAIGDAPSQERARPAIANEMSNALLSLPGDAFFLNQVSPQHDLGYVAYLRRVVEVQDSCVVTAQSQIPYNAVFRRLTRLRAPYVYALSQQFAAVFSAVGLPTEYESAREGIIERLKRVGA